MFDYTIPVLHPLLVHFPLTLLLVAAPVAIVWAVRRTAFWRGMLLLLLALGTLGALGAYLTGEAVKVQSEGVPIVDELVGQHETLGLWTLLVAGAATLFVVLMHWRERRSPLPGLARWLAVVLALAAAVLVAWTGHLGALMVWGVPA